MLNKFLADLVDTIQRILFMVGIIATIGAFIRQWLQGLDTLQFVLMLTALGSFIIFGIMFWLKWMDARSIENLPELLSQIDQMILDYIDDFNPDAGGQADALIDDLAGLLNLNIGQLKSAMTRQDKNQTQAQMQNIMRQYERLVAPKNKTQETLTNLLLMGEVMNDYHVGLSNLTDTPKYKQLHRKIRMLQRRVPSREVSIKINDYFQWSEALYCMLLSTKPLTNQRELYKLIPVRARATSNLFRHLVESNTTTLISAVHESIQRSKQKRGKNEL